MKNFTLLVAAFVGLAAKAWAGQPEYRPGPPGDPAPAAIATCAYGSARAELDINNVRCLLFDGGDMWWDLVCCARYEVPRVDDPGGIKRNSLYAASIWVSGRELGTNNIFVMAMTYRPSGNQSYWPGPIDNLTTFTTTARCQVWDKMFKVNRTDVVAFEAKQAANGVHSVDDVPESILKWPGKGNPYLALQRGYEGINTNYDLARFLDNDHDGIYDPVNGDSPQLPGRTEESSGADQCIFWVMNDVGNQKKFSNTTTNSRAIGMEVQTEAFAYSTSDYTNDMTFYRQKLTNKGTTILRDCYFGQWADPDLGYSSDDYVQFNVPRGLAICYNGDDFDEGVQGYGANPPSVAIDFFKGPAADPNDGIDNDRDGVVDELGELIIASNFVYYNNASDGKVGDPSVAQEYFNYQRSIWKDGTVMTYDLKNGTSVLGASIVSGGQSFPAPKCVFAFPACSDQAVGWGNGGSPTNPKPLPCWSEETAGNPKGDRRMLTNAGAFTLRPGAVNELTIGVVWARTTTGGATGSFNKLLAADDAAQKLFDNDFKILDGPDAPDVEITELDQQLLFTILPHSSRNGTLTTETYKERDFNARLVDPYYRFEGYLVYQLFDGSVGFGDLDNPDKAKLIADVSSDIKNGVATIINSEFDETVGAFQQRVKVRGTDQGLIRTFAIDQDQFATGGGSLVNYHKYYYTVLAYGYNGDSSQQVQYIQGRQNRQKYTAIPHKTAPENNGTVLNSKYNQTLDVTRLQGQGNGGVSFDSLNAQDEIEILANNSKLPIRYTNGNSPVQVKVYNPKKVVGADLTLRLYGRVSYTGDINQFAIGDTIVSTWNSIPDTGTLIIDPILVQKPGIGVVIAKRTRAGGDATSIDLEVNMLNDGVGGRFTAAANIVQASPRRFTSYTFLPEVFFKKGNTQQTAVCTDFQTYDFWRLYEGEEKVDSAARPISFLRDQLATRYGLLISISNFTNPGEFVFTNLLNGYLPGSVVFGNRSKQWFETIPSPAADAKNNPLNWWRQTGIFNPDGLGRPGVIEIAGALRHVLDGSFGNYGYLAPYKTSNYYSGGAYPFGSDVIVDSVAKASLAHIQNVDIVLTSDQSKWTRCIVIQGDSIRPTGAISQTYAFQKSRLYSVNADMTPSNESSLFRGIPSRGISYFPGYAIDLDRGIRLNMAFLESAFSDKKNGNNLHWDLAPADSSANGNFGGKSYMYVFATPYDGGKRNEYVLDSISKTISIVTTFQRAYAKFWANCIWTGRLAAPAQGGVTPLATNARIRLRVAKSYVSYPDSGGVNGTPTYSFTTNGLQPSVQSREVAKSALDLIRVVPNPYYAYSTYEQSQIDNRIRITNLPTKCQISIFTLSGTLIRQYKVDNSTQTGVDQSTFENFNLNKTTYLDWDLKTQTGLPIASGAYIMHINAYELGETTVKWFGVMRPTDLDAISQ